MPTAAPAPPAAPAAPPPKPSAPQAPPPAAKPTAPAPPPPAGEQPDVFASAFADLDSLDRGEKPAPKKAPAPPPENEDPDAEVTGEVGEDEAGEKAPGEKTVPIPPKSGEQQTPGRPLKAPELRTAYAALKQKVTNEYEPRLRELQQKLAEVESGNAPLPAEVKERLEGLEKRNTELEQHIKFVDFSRSKEYQEQYWKPYVKAWSEAVSELKGLTMEVEDPQTGETTSREVTETDLQYLAGLDPVRRRQEINRLFPEDKEEVKRHINEISRLFDESQTALKKAHEEADKHVKSRSDQESQSKQMRAQQWKQANEALATKYPKWFAPIEGDTDGNQLLERGRVMADLVFSPQDVQPAQLELLPKAFQGKELTQQQVVMLYSIVRNKAINHDRLAHQLTAAQKRVADLEKSLRDYEESGPDKVPAGGRGARSGDKGFMQDAAEELEGLERKYANA